MSDDFDEGMLGDHPPLADRVITAEHQVADIAVARARSGGGTASGRAHPSMRPPLNDVPTFRRTCRVCRCTDADCSECRAKTGMPCWWVDTDLCSACVIGDTPLERLERADNLFDLNGTTELVVELDDDIDWSIERPTFGHNVAGHVLLWALQRWPRLATYVHDRTEPTRLLRRSARG